MDSNTNQVNLPASEMEDTFMPSDSSPRKRVRSETAEDFSRNATSNHGTFAQTSMDIDTNNPNQDQRQPPSTTASSDNSTADQSLYMQYLKDTFAAVINARVKKYGSDRVELYKRQVALRSLRNHATKNTFPKDLCFSIQTGNPYKKTNPERDTLMQQEQTILLQAKQSILQQRIKVAEDEIQRYDQLCMSYHPDNNNTIVQEFHNTFNNQIILTEEQTMELTSAYRVNFIQKQTNMDLLHAKKEALYKKHLEKQQKTTPISATLNEQQFKSSIIDMMKSFLDANNKKVSKKNNSNSSKPQRKQQQAPLSNNKKKQQLPAEKKKTNYPSSYNNNDKQHTKKTTQRRYDNNNNNNNNLSPPLRNTNNGINSSFTRKPATNHPTSILSNNTNRDTYANKVKSQQHREVKIIHLNDDDTIDNDDGFTIVKRGKNKKQQSNQPKNVSASDPRNVPKRRN